MRNRRSLALAIAILVTAAAGTAGAVVALLKRPPAFYGTCEGPRPLDGRVGPGVITKFGDLKNDIRSKPEWGASFTADELNAFFRDSLGAGGPLTDFLPDELSEPRVSIDGDRVRIGVRYGTGFWSSILSIELRAWLVKPAADAADPNTVALELVGIWAGSLPVGTQAVLESISEAARDSNVAVNWYRHVGHPVGVFRFYADQARPPTVIRRFQIADGRVTVAGVSQQDVAGVPSAASEQEGE